MHAFHLGRRERRLYGAYDPPNVTLATNKAVVFCAPWGKEYMNSHRALRQLSLRLAAAGCHCLRFDWYGCGDSWGEGADGDVDGWKQDLTVAVEELKAMSGVARVFVVGLRLGAALAFQGALGRADVAGVALWDPILDGRAYLRELAQMDQEIPRQASSTSLGGDGFVDLLGFSLTDTQRKGIERIQCAPEDAKWGGLLMVASEDRPEYSEFCDGLPGKHDFEVVPGPKSWVEQPEIWAGAIPVPQLQRIEQWLSSA